VLHGYHDAVTAAIRDAGGFIAKFMGDGVLVYFGYPQASEDAWSSVLPRAASRRCPPI
jgi:class 3 adenylate cyclase